QSCISKVIRLKQLKSLGLPETSLSTNTEALLLQQLPVLRHLEVTDHSMYHCLANYLSFFPEISSLSVYSVRYSGAPHLKCILELRLEYSAHADDLITNSLSSLTQLEVLHLGQV